MYVLLWMSLAQPFTACLRTLPRCPWKSAVINNTMHGCVMHISSSNHSRPIGFTHISLFCDVLNLVVCETVFFSTAPKCHSSDSQPLLEAQAAEEEEDKEVEEGVEEKQERAMMKR